MNTSPSRQRPWLVPAIVGGAVLLLVLVFRGALFGWFTGRAETAPSGGGVTQAAGPFQLTATLGPDPPAQRGNALWLALKDAQGQPVEGARVQVEYRMPPMGGMSEMKGEAEVTERAAGTYVARYDLPMAGGWTLHLTVDANGAHGEADYGLTVGSAGLVAKGSAGGGGTSAGDGGVAYYTCAMHPSVHADKPGACPICGMTLHPVTKGGEEGAVTLDASERANADVRTAPVVRAPLTLTTRTLGQVKVDETKLTDVTLRVGGYIHALEVDATGQAVRKGQVLFTLYSPELFAAEQEYLLALRTQTAGVAGELLKAGKQKLRLWGLSDAQIAEVAKRGAPIENLPFRSPTTGVVLEKDVVEGSAVTAGQRLYRIAPLDPVWIEAQVYERDLPSVRVGQAAKVSVPSLPGRSFEGKVTFISPTLESATRTAVVRVELANPGLLLKPAMFADVLLEEDAGERLQVPSSAVLYTGPRRIVFVDEGHGRLVPRDVVLGARSGDRDEVVRGLSQGERVVTHGNFLIAAESRLQATSFWATPADAGTPEERR
jgi:Cu(I)/Ag(I) efflux system membrane fusion protein